MKIEGVTNCTKKFSTIFGLLTKRKKEAKKEKAMIINKYFIIFIHLI